MNELLEQVLNDAGARDDGALAALAAEAADTYLPWSAVDEA